jgi:hypothetical protein
MGSGAIVFVDALGRVHETMHRMLGDITEDELVREPHPSIGWLAWRLTRVTDSIPSGMANREQLWVADGWAERFGMKPEPYDFGRSHSHTRQQVKDLKCSSELLLDYHDAVYERTKAYFASLTDEELARELNEPQYTPLPTVSVRLVSWLENAMHNAGQIVYLKAYHRLGGWFPSEAKDRTTLR